MVSDTTSDDELRERILSNLTTSDLRHARLVSRTWQKVVDSLEPLQPLPFRATAGTAVSRVVELLEHILLHADIEDLFAWQRVSPRWHDVVADSKPLQRKLFLLPVPERSLLEWRPNTLSGTTTGQSAIQPTVSESTATESSRTAVIARLHPWLDLHALFLKEKRRLTFTLWPKTFPCVDQESWQHISLTQPPATEVSLYYAFGIKADRVTKGAFVHNAGGVTFGDMIRRISIDVDKLRAAGPFRLPPHAELFDDAGVLDDRLLARFMEQLHSHFMVGTIKGFVADSSPWVAEGRRKIADGAGIEQDEQESVRGEG